MSQKNVKKLKKEVEQQTQRMRFEIEEKVMEKFFTQTVKPKPKWLPKTLWLWALHRLLNF